MYPLITSVVSTACLGRWCCRRVGATTTFIDGPLYNGTTVLASTNILVVYFVRTCCVRSCRMGPPQLSYHDTTVTPTRLTKPISKPNSTYHAVLVLYCLRRLCCSFHSVPPSKQWGSFDTIMLFLRSQYSYIGWSCRRFDNGIDNQQYTTMIDGNHRLFLTPRVVTLDCQAAALLVHARGNRQERKRHQTAHASIPKDAISKYRPGILCF